MAALESMDPPGKDVQIVRSYYVVPRGVGGYVPSSLANMPAFGEIISFVR